MDYEKRSQRQGAFLRWMDDVIHIWDSSIKRGTWTVLRYLQRASAYGDTLLLVRTYGGNAFGFRWTTESGILRVEQEPKWINDFKQHQTVSKGSRVFQGNQGTSGKTRKGVLLGYMLRLLDCTSAPGREVHQAMVRLIEELRYAQNRVERIIEAMRESEKQAQMTIPRYPLGWTGTQRQQFRLTSDAHFRLRCNVQDTFLLLQEKNDAFAFKQKTGARADSRVCLTPVFRADLGWVLNLLFVSEGEKAGFIFFTVGFWLQDLVVGVDKIGLLNSVKMLVE